MNKKQNLVVTLIVVSTVFLCGTVIPNISDAMTVIGATTNPLCGFTLPIVFYLKMDALRDLIKIHKYLFRELREEENTDAFKSKST